MNTNSCTILLAPQGFKGTWTASQVAEAMETGVRRALPQARCILMPVADGGDGTLEVLLRAKSGSIQKSHVAGPLGQEIEAEWGIYENTALIETASVCGLRLIGENERNPALTTTYGIGQVIRAAWDQGLRHFVIGLGGSATHDAGAGLLQALGAELVDKNGQELPRGGLALKDLHHIRLEKLDQRLKDSSLIVCCDCLNPLTGPAGAAMTYAPQKGASPEMVQELEQAAAQFARVVQQDLGKDIATLEGGGAAGGMGAGLALLGAKLVPGIDMILKLIHFNEALKTVDLVITGEGRMDRQTTFNKAPLGVAKAAKAANVPVLAIVGSLGEGYEELHQKGIDAIIPLSFAPASALNQLSLLTQATEESLRLINIR